MSKNFQPLSSGEVLSVSNASSFVMGHSTFRVDEFAAALKKLLLEQGVGGLTEETIDWLTDNGIECDVLRFGASGWVKGKVRLHLEFAEGEAGEASADPKPKAAADSLPSVAANDVSSPVTPTASEADQSALGDLDLEFDEADFADLSLELDDDSGAELPDIPDIEESDSGSLEQVFDGFDDLDLETTDEENVAPQDESDDFEALFGQEQEGEAGISPEPEADFAEQADDLEDLFGEDTSEPEAVSELEADFAEQTDDLEDLFGEDTSESEAVSELEADFAKQADDLEDLFDEEDSDFDVLVAAEPDDSGADLGFEQADEADLDALFGEEDTPEAIGGEAESEEGIAPEPVDSPEPGGKATVVSQDTLVQPDDVSLEELTEGASESAFEEITGEDFSADNLDELFEEEELTADVPDDQLEDLFGDTDNGEFEAELFDEASDANNELELDDEPTAITVEDEVDFEDDSSLEDLFETPEASTEEDVFQSLLADDGADTFDNSDDLLDTVEDNPFVSSEDANTLPDSLPDEEEDPFAVFTDTGEDSLDDLDEDLDLSLEAEGEEDIFNEVEADLDDLFDDTDTAETVSHQSSNEDLGEFINVAMLRKKQ